MSNPMTVVDQQLWLLSFGDAESRGGSFLEHPVLLAHMIYPAERCLYLDLLVKSLSASNNLPFIHTLRIASDGQNIAHYFSDADTTVASMALSFAGRFAVVSR